MKKIFLSIIFFFFWNTSLQAVQFTGEATEYGITLTYAELCETGSTVSNCVNPVVLGSGDSGTIDIANTTAGAAAASFSLSAAHSSPESSSFSRFGEVFPER